MSRGQKLTKDYLPKLMSCKVWKGLSKKDKVNFGLALKDRAQSDNDVSEQIESLVQSEIHDSIYFVNRIAEIQEEEIGL